MKLSISLPESDVAALDRFARASGITTRSAAIQRAIRRLGDVEMDAAYASAWQEWESSGGAAAWEDTSADGLTDAAR